VRGKQRRERQRDGTKGDRNHLGNARPARQKHACSRQKKRRKDKPDIPTPRLGKGGRARQSLTKLTGETPAKRENRGFNKNNQVHLRTQRTSNKPERWKSKKGLEGEERHVQEHNETLQKACCREDAPSELVDGAGGGKKQCDYLEP